MTSAPEAFPGGGSDFTIRRKRRDQPRRAGRRVDARVDLVREWREARPSAASRGCRLLRALNFAGVRSRGGERITAQTTLTARSRTTRRART